MIDPTSTVSQLIDEERKWWKKELLDQIFTREEITTINSIPISQTNQEDKLIWRGTTNGVFSVRSAYHMPKEREEARII